MLKAMPGTAFPFSEENKENAFKSISMLLSVTNGMSLGEITEMTGMNNSTIQNWVKRGWVANPKGKRYGKKQILRIILMNMLRNALQLEAIVELMEYINGDVEDESDDIISDEELYNRLCWIIYLVDEQQTIDKEKIKKIISDDLSSYNAPSQEAKNRLSKALLIMSMAYISSEIQKQAEEEYKKIKTN
ncbi:MAG: DUF1836 domain-containing protein [Clostridiales bacterium]|nr:DUF1836 domain-containing protein [Clostridiales bacterium]